MILRPRLRLNEALEILKGGDSGKREAGILLACGFEPLHLRTFLRAYHRLRHPLQSLDFTAGLFGDLQATLSSAAKADVTGAIVVLEWSDLDPRLGLRTTGGWSLSLEQDILACCSRRWTAIADAIRTAASAMPVAAVLPTLAPSLLGHTPGTQISPAEVALEIQFAAMLADLTAIPNVRVLHPGHLAKTSPAANRRNPSLEWMAGFPYSLEHASALAAQIIDLVFPPPPLKGLITDLDDTLWSGIAGETGAAGLGWTLETNAQPHGLYQQQLRQFSEMGVLIGVVSKNEPATVEEAFARRDLLIPASAFYPVKCGWGTKSKAVGEVLDAWNIGPESVAFVDDSEMELGEVREAFPSITTLAFPSRSPGRILELLEQLRDLFGKPELHSEDRLRQTSVRNAAEFRGHAGSPDWLRSLEGKITFDTRRASLGRRPLELINKTNQFNLNGIRIAEGEWMRFAGSPDTFVVAVSYEDRFGPLGVIGVICGKRTGRSLEVSSWVLSCRAFSRCIENHMLAYLFSRAAVIDLVFEPTARNRPLQDFLIQLDAACGEIPLRLFAERHAPRHDQLPHEVRIHD